MFEGYEILYSKQILVPIQASDAAFDFPQLEELPNVQAVNTSVNPLNPADYVLTNFVGDLAEQVVNVRGSLTTPPCSPANWLLATQIREISRNDVSGGVLFGVYVIN